MSKTPQPARAAAPPSVAIAASTPEPRGCIPARVTGAVRPASGGVLRSSSAPRRRPGSAAVSIAATSSSAGITDEEPSPPRTERRSDSAADDTVSVRTRGAPLPHFQRPNSSRGQRILPAPSVSKTGYMSELSIGTRQLARSGAQALAADKKSTTKRRKPAVGASAISVDLDLDEFGKGARSDGGTGQRNKELVSSPRHDLRVRRREGDSNKYQKASNFCKSMDLRYAQDGEPLEVPPQDPIDLKYQKYGLRRPLSSREAAKRRPPVPADEEVDPLIEIEEILRGADSPHTQYGGDELTKPALAFLSRADAPVGDRSAHIPADEGVPCIGQYMPRFALVSRGTPQAPKWDRNVTIPRSRPPRETGRQRPYSAPPVLDAHDTTVRSGVALSEAPVSELGGTVPGSVLQQPQQQQPAQQQQQHKQAHPSRKTAALRPSASFMTPGRGELALDKQRPGEITTKPWRPSPHFPGAGQSKLTAAPDVVYWPYDQWDKRVQQVPPLSRQVGREEAMRTGYTLVLSGLGGCGPDAVYDKATAALNAMRAAPTGSLRFQHQVPRDTSTRTSTTRQERFVGSDSFHDFDVSVLSTRRGVQKCRDWSVAKPRDSAGQADNRKELDTQAALEAVRRRVPTACNYDSQTARPELLHPNPYIQLQYDVRTAAVDRRQPATDFHSQTARGAGAAAVLAARATEAEWTDEAMGPSVDAVKRRSDRAPLLRKEERWRRVAVTELRGAKDSKNSYRALDEDGDWCPVTVLHAVDENSRTYAAKFQRPASAGDADNQQEVRLCDVERKVTGDGAGGRAAAQMTDLIYDWQSVQEAAARRKQGIGFDKLLTRERRNKCMQSQQHTADTFYDPKPPAVRGHVSFAKTLSRNKRAAGHMGALFPDKEDARARGR